MRIYIIGNEGITLYREAPTTVNEGEITVASNEELHAAPLSAKRLLALWNALPGVEKRRKVGDREALIDQLWSAIEALPVPERAQSLQRTAPSWRAKVQCSGRRRFADGVLAHVRTPGGPTSSAQPLFCLTRSPPTPCRCPSLTRSNRRGTDPYARWWGRGGTARCPPIPISGRVGV